MTSDGARKGLKEIIEDIAERLLPLAYTRIGIPPSKPKKRLRVVLGRVRFSQDINAYYDCKNNKVIINDELMVFYHKMLKVFVSTLIVGDTPNHTTEELRIPPDRILSVCKELMQAYLAKRLMAQSGFTLAELGEDQIEILSRLVRSCECFDVGHELGHFVIRSTKGQVAEYATARKTVEDFLDGIPDLSKEQKLKIIGPWTDEICADLIGLQLSLTQSNTEPYNSWPNYKQWLCAGAEVSLLLPWMLREFDDRLNHGSKVTIISTHPYEYLRWEAIHSSPEILSSPDTLDIGKAFFMFAWGILEEMFTKTDNGCYALRIS